MKTAKKRKRARVRFSSPPESEHHSELEENSHYLTRSTDTNSFENRKSPDKTIRNKRTRSLLTPEKSKSLTDTSHSEGKRPKRVPVKFDEIPSITKKKAHILKSSKLSSTVKQNITPKGERKLRSESPRSSKHVDTPELSKRHSTFVHDKEFQKPKTRSTKNMSSILSSSPEKECSPQKEVLSPSRKDSTSTKEPITRLSSRRILNKTILNEQIC